MFEIPAWLLAWFYGITGNYAIAIALIAVVVMARSVSRRPCTEASPMAPTLPMMARESGG